MAGPFNGAAPYPQKRKRRRAATRVAAVAALLTLPAPRAVRAQIVGLTSMLLQPFAAVLPFAAFPLRGACVRGLGLAVKKLLLGSGSDDRFAFFFSLVCRYLLEERAQADLHGGDVHLRGACPLREIRE